ncbi:MAG: alpha-1,2-fucosyltransferase, partial [Lutibacter sp.]|nr:alpha-1,2-fucosyltransferase [Lutibacter sp.]
MGGLGNQMFQFCTGLNLSKRLNTKFTIDDSFLMSNLTSEHSVKRNLDLEIFNIHSRHFFNGIFRGKINPITRNFNKILPVNLRSYYVEKDFNYDNNILLLNDNTTIEGYWQSYKYFDGIENEIQEAFKFVNELLEQSQNIHKEITNCESVCINVRRADFAVNSFHGTLEIEYYMNAVDLIKSKINSEVHFFIFSDDIDWC